MMMRRISKPSFALLAVTLLGVVGLEVPASAVTPLAPSVTVSKLVSIDGGFTFGASGSAPSGTSLLYKVTVSNGSGVSATAVQFSDVIPQFLTYIPGSGRVATAASTTYSAATVLTDAADADGYGFASGSSTVSYSPGGSTGTIAPGGALVLFLRATVNPTAANTIISNSAVVNYNLAGSGVQPPLTASATVTVALIPSPVILSSPANQTIRQGDSAALRYTIVGAANGPDSYTIAATVTPSNVSSTTATVTTPLGLGGTTLAVPAVAGNTTITVPYDGNPSNIHINGARLAAGSMIVVGSNAYTIASIVKNPASNTTNVGLTTPIVGAPVAATTIVGEERTFAVSVPSGTISSGRSGTQSVSVTATSLTAPDPSTSQATPTVISVINPSVTCSAVTGNASMRVTFRQCSPVSKRNVKAKILGSQLTSGGTLTWIKSAQTTTIAITSTSPGRGACPKHFTEHDISGSVSGGTSVYTHLNDPVAIRICQSNVTGSISLVPGTTAAL